MGMRSTVVLTACLVSSILLVAGCPRRDSTAERRDSDPCAIRKWENDSVRQFLVNNVRQAPEGSVWKKYRTLALEKWQNGVLDPEPILLLALLSNSSKDRQPYLTVITFDEDRDIAGIGIEEQRWDATGRTTETVVEEYPVAAHVNQSDTIDVICTLRVPVRIRDAAQRKNPDAWEQYVAHPFSPGTERVTRWRQDLPPLWISAPQPNTVNVRIYAYDRVGHRSDAVEVSDRLAAGAD